PSCLACANCGCSAERQAASATAMRGNHGKCGHTSARERSGVPPGLANATAPTNASIQRRIRTEPHQNRSLAERLFVGVSPDPSLLKGFTRGRMMGRLSLFWRTLRNDPAPSFARCDEHELRSGAGAEPIRQGTVLNAPRGGYFTPVTHRRCTLLNAYSQFFNT